MAAGYIFYAYGMVVTQAFNGAGDTRTPTKINFIAFWLIQLPFAYLVSIHFNWGSLGVFVAITLAEVLIVYDVHPLVSKRILEANRGLS